MLRYLGIRSNRKPTDNQIRKYLEGKERMMRNHGYTTTGDK